MSTPARRPTPQATPPADRVSRLEEHAAFTERAVEQLSQEIAAINRRLHTAVTRLGTLEARVAKLLSEPEPDDPE